MAMYTTTQPFMGDERIDLIGKALQAFNATNGTGGASPVGYKYPTCDPQEGDFIYDRYGKFAQAKTIAAL